MSIIHEALKKAEREREVRPRWFPLFGGVRIARQRWRPGAVSGMLIGLGTLGAVGLWLGVYTPWREFSVSTVGPIRRDLPTAGEEQAALLTLIPQPLPIQSPFPWTPPPQVDDRPDSPVPPTPTWEAQLAAQAAFERARTAESAGHWVEAMGYYRQTLALNPALLEARNNLGTLYIRRQQLTAAIDEFRTVIRLDPHYAMVRNNLGSAYILNGQETLAIQEFLAAMDIDGTYVSPLYNLASLYARRGDVGQTVAFLTRALALEPAVLSWLQEDSDFDEIRTAPEVRRLYTQGRVER